MNDAMNQKRCDEQYGKSYHLRIEIVRPHVEAVSSWCFYMARHFTLIDVLHRELGLPRTISV